MTIFAAAHRIHHRHLGNSLMRLALIALALSLAGCAGVGAPIKPSVAVQTNIAAVGYGFDAAYQQAGQAFVAVAPSLPVATKTQIKGLFALLLTCQPGATTVAQCTGYVASADAAVMVFDQPTLTQQVAQIAKVVGQIYAVINPADPAPVPSIATLSAPVSSAN